MLSYLAPAAAATLLLIAILIWQRLAFPGHRELAVSLCFGALFFAYRADSPALFLLQPVLCVGPLACNRAIRATFEVAPRPLWLDGVLLAVLLGAGIYGYAAAVPWAARLFDVVALGLFIELPVVVWRGLPDDLVAARRQARLWCLGVGAGLSLAIALASLLGQADLGATVGAAAVIVLSWVTVAIGDRVYGRAAPIDRQLDNRDAAVLRRLRGLMTEGLYRDPGLSLSRLAQRLAIPEHQLRRVIHVGEGERNFSAYLNSLRIAEVRAALDQPSRDGDTVLTLAVAAGYNSLSAFNRAFKTAEGLTPSAYRAARTAKTTPSPRNSTDTLSETTTP